VSGRSKKKARDQAFNQTVNKMFAGKISVEQARARLGYEPGGGRKQAAAGMAKSEGP
jgi:hypothetical protein